MDPNKSNNNILNYIFNKNTFSLSKPSNIIKNKDLSYCQKYSLKNNKPGFKFYGNNNKCFLYSNDTPSKKLDNSLINNYSPEVIRYNKADFSLYCVLNGKIDVIDLENGALLNNLDLGIGITSLEIMYNR